MRTTLLTNVFNEEYLLPFWLEHHKNMFDDIIVVDYKSTDKSMEICKRICPNCTIIKTRNAFFDAREIDKEFMDIENSIEGIKIVLNTTEFLFCETNVRDIFKDITEPTSCAVNALTPFSINNYTINNIYELFNNLLNNDVVYHSERGERQLHTYPNGNYTIGRHHTFNTKNIFRTDKAHIIWFGFYPMNDKLLKRKLQIQQNIPQSDKDGGFGVQHLFDKEKILSINRENSQTGQLLENINRPLYNLLYSKYRNKTFIVTGGCGFIGSHMVDKLISLGYKVIVIDNLLSGNLENLNPSAVFENIDIRNFELLNKTIEKYNVDGIFHFAAIARTPWCIDDPILCYETNVMGTLNILESARKNSIKRVVLSSSNVVYAFFTPYRTSKEALEGLAAAYTNMYNMSVISLRYSNVYGKRQSETGPSPNVFAALRKSKKDLGKLILTGDGTQTRNYTHVSDIVNGNLLSMFNDYCGVIDLCTGKQIELNYAASFFECPIEYIDERPGDVKHIIQSPDEAYRILGWKALTELEDGIKDVL